ncbi:MAG: hypothetical protein AAF654_13705 [Myxococcota bacterium]
MRGRIVIQGSEAGLHSIRVGKDGALEQVDLAKIGQVVNSSAAAWGDFVVVGAKGGDRLHALRVGENGALQPTGQSNAEGVLGTPHVTHDGIVVACTGNGYLYALKLNEDGALHQTDRVEIGSTWATPLVVDRGSERFVIACNDKNVLSYLLGGDGSLKEVDRTNLGGETTGSPVETRNGFILVGAQKRLHALHLDDRGALKIVSDEHVGTVGRASMTLNDMAIVSSDKGVLQSVQVEANGELNCAKWLKEDQKQRSSLAVTRDGFVLTSSGLYLNAWRLGAGGALESVAKEHVGRHFAFPTVTADGYVIVPTQTQTGRDSPREQWLVSFALREPSDSWV